MEACSQSKQILCLHFTIGVGLFIWAFLFSGFWAQELYADFQELFADFQELFAEFQELFAQRTCNILEECMHHWGDMMMR